MRSLALALFILLAGCEKTPRFTVEAAPEYDALFDRRAGWTGADVAGSLALGGDRVLWLFGDTWIGKVRDGKHTDARMVSNTVAIQKGLDPAKAALEFYHGRQKGEPAAFLTPARGPGKFWLSYGIATNRGLFLFMSRIVDKPGDTSVFGFKAAGTVMVHVHNPEEPPGRWNLSQTESPWTRNGPDGSDTQFDAPLLRKDGMIYIYGLKTRPTNRYLLVARVAEQSLPDFSAWRFYSHGKWVSDFTKSSRLADDFGAEMSVSYQDALKRYVAVYTKGGLSRDILMRSASSPEGPWSKPLLLYRTPEMDWDKDYFCYAAKAHQELSRRQDELLVSYVCNSHDFWKMAADARIYRPRFLRVRFRQE